MIFGYNQNLNTSSKNEVWRDWKIIEKNGATCSRQLPSFIWMNPGTSAKLYQYSLNGEVTKLFHPGNNKHQYGYRSTTGKLNYSFVHSYIHSINISQATTLFHTWCKVLKIQQEKIQSLPSRYLQSSRENDYYTLNFYVPQNYLGACYKCKMPPMCPDVLLL